MLPLSSSQPHRQRHGRQRHLKGTVMTMIAFILTIVGLWVHIIWADVIHSADTIIIHLQRLGRGYIRKSSIQVVNSGAGKDFVKKTTKKLSPDFFHSFKTSNLYHPAKRLISLYHALFKQMSCTTYLLRSNRGFFRGGWHRGHLALKGLKIGTRDLERILGHK